VADRLPVAAIATLPQSAKSDGEATVVIGSVKDGWRYQG
jgi:hypothetical protein